MNFKIWIEPMLDDIRILSTNGLRANDYHYTPATNEFSRAKIIVDNDLEMLESLASSTIGAYFRSGNERIESGFPFTMELDLNEDEKKHIRYYQAVFPLISHFKDVLGVRGQLEKIGFVNKGGAGKIRISYPLFSGIKNHPKKIKKGIFSLLDGYSEIGCSQQTLYELMEFIPASSLFSMFNEHSDFQFYHISNIPFAPAVDAAVSTSILANDWSESHYDGSSYYDQAAPFLLRESIKEGHLLRFRDPFFLCENPDHIISRDLFSWLRKKGYKVKEHPIIEPLCPFLENYVTLIQSIKAIVSANPLNHLSLNRGYY